MRAFREEKGIHSCCMHHPVSPRLRTTSTTSNKHRKMNTHVCLWNLKPKHLRGKGLYICCMRDPTEYWRGGGYNLVNLHTLDTYKLNKKRSNRNTWASLDSYMIEALRETGGGVQFQCMHDPVECMRGGGHTSTRLCTLWTRE